MFLKLTADEAYALIAFIKMHEREDIPDDVWDICMALTDVREAARYFGIYWEAPRFYNAEREANAVAALEYFGGGAG